MSKFLPITNAIVPIIKMTFEDVEIDLLLSILPLDVIPTEFDQVDDRLLFDMSDKCILSINGKRNTDKIINIVQNQDTFGKVLRLVKFWAKRRGI